VVTTHTCAAVGVAGLQQPAALNHNCKSPHHCHLPAQLSTRRMDPRRHGQSRVADARNVAMQQQQQQLACVH
jgi:hypothetical protein